MQNGVDPQVFVRIGPHPPASNQQSYDRGVRARRELIPTARKVLRDFAVLAPGDPDGPAIQAVLEGILREADRWGDHSWGTKPDKGPNLETLPENAVLDRDEIAAWAAGINDLLKALDRLGTYCHFRLKSERKSAAGDAAVSVRSGAPAVDYAQLKIKNTILNNLEILLGRTALSSYPVRIEIDPTNECNLRCRACRHGITKDFRHVEMRHEYVEVLTEAFPFVDYLYPYGTGEPTMSSMLPSLLREAAKHQVKVDLLTNGTLLAHADLPWESFHRLGVSVDGASEETMRALRPTAPLATILAAVRMMRAKAPQATLYAKVTVSRVNYDEIPEIVEKLAGVGINEVIVHSLHAYSPIHDQIQSRASDREHLQQCVASARAVADRRGVRFMDILNFDFVARSETAPRSKEAMFKVLEGTPPPILEIRELSELKTALETWTFTYYPRGLGEHKGAGGSSMPCASQTSSPVRIGTIDDVLARHLEQARQLTAAQVSVPYCFTPWKMPLIDSDGRARACCHLSGYLGDLDQGKGFEDVWSSPGYVELRESMFDAGKLPDGCAGCQELDRSTHSDQTIALADFLGVPVRQATHYPRPMDVGELLRSSQLAPPEWELLGPAGRLKPDVFELAPGAQILLRFPNPRTTSGVYYQGRFCFKGGPVLLGIKPIWGPDIWNFLIEPEFVAILGDWVGLPMPSLPLDFSAVPEPECAVFLWAPSSNGTNVEIRIAEFSGVAAAPAPVRRNGLQAAHLWSGITAGSY